MNTLAATSNQLPLTLRLPSKISLNYDSKLSRLSSTSRALVGGNPRARAIKCSAVSLVDSPEAFIEASKKGNLIPLHRCIFSDHLSPVLAYRCLVKEDDREAPSFLFESVEPGLQVSNVGRYSVVGAQPSIEILAKENVVTILNHEEGKRTEEIVEDPMTVPRRIMEKWKPQLIDELPDAFCGGWVGYFSYDTVRYVEKKKLPFSSAPTDDRNLPDVHLGLYDDVIVFDHVNKGNQRKWLRNMRKDLNRSKRKTATTSTSVDEELGSVEFESRYSAIATTTTGGKYLYNLANYNKPNAASTSNDGKSNNTTPVRTITLRSTANGEAKKEGPSKYLSDVEFNAKREKGLCFKCDEKYYSVHKCKDMELRELRMFVVHDDNVEEEIIEEDCYDPKELNMFEMEGGVNVVVELSINSVVGLTNLGTMKVRGKLQGEELHTKETSHYGVILESGTAIKGKGVCENVEIMLRVTETDWRNLTMTFFHEGKKIIIKGESSLTKTRIGLKTMMKAWTDSDQGYLVECRVLEGRVILSEEVVEDEVDMVPADVNLLMSSSGQKHCLQGEQLNIRFI
ncbi:anthranilate synthase alpha subunit 2 [Cucumis melo var. makuwa]|uniref:Anthranilate synthase alpha subunit 2 n=1 Tax=Cucumis melo var. makuwa TaxID=1194695 RepID=A0A5A7TIB0_CUCMM|nr:anthranilate synthase alpha subunit 2 [Cucumis melo var. makuwa]